MLNVIKKEDGKTLTIFLEGRLDTVTAPQLETVIGESTDGVTGLILDMEKLEYISSAGLRVILATKKKMNGIGDLKLKNVCDGVMEVFEITGFTDILTIE